MFNVQFDGCVLAYLDGAERLQKLKQKVSLFALDYDGTIYGAGVSHREAAELIHRVMVAGVIPTILTGRGMTLQGEFLPALLELLEGKRGRCFLGTANGLELTEIRNGEPSSIYRRGSLKVEEVVKVAETYLSLGLSCNSSSIDALVQTATVWQETLAQERLDLIFNYKKIWIEDSLVLLPLPEDNPWQVVSRLKSELADDLEVSMAGRGVAIITRALGEDPKRFCLNMVLREVALSADDIAIFGDNPEGNDRALLELPNSFTNRADYVAVPHRPPFLLAPSCDGSPVRQVHRCIAYLLAP